jgi:hypothetical protein
VQATQLGLQSQLVLCEVAAGAFVGGIGVFAEGGTTGTEVLVGRSNGTTEVGANEVRVAATPDSITTLRGLHEVIASTAKKIIGKVR